MSRSFGFVLKDVNGLYVQRFEQHAAAFGLTLPQCRTLMRLSENEGVSQVRLAELTDIEPMTLVRILDRMAAEGWLERRTDPRDRRVRCLYLTSQGKPLLEVIHRLMDLTLADAFSGISKEKREMLTEVLDKIRNNLLSSAPVHAVVARGAERAVSKS